ncbi:NHL repeat-containing protein [Tuber magnatum]|uniref:NHL repeat-containing protein n=1 Tax=Tuber magnatum TaxID=42249 RepID=A0A317T5G7_9PEZI|nr:NHL repeat-containing protein [Tuber magnatum]
MILQQLDSYFLLALSILSLVTAVPAPDPNGDREISVYIVPGNRTFPEGIARQKNSPYFYVGSVTTGDIYRGSVYEKHLVHFITGSTHGLTNAVGMKIDCEDRLYVAGGASGTLFAFDLHTKKLLHRFSNGFGLDANATLLNDLDIDEAGNVYITDSIRPTVFRVGASEVNRPTVDLALEKWTDLTGTMGPGGNGIVVTEDQRHLLVANVYAGEIWRVVISSRKVDKVDLGGTGIGGPDGLLIRDNILYSVNAFQEIGQFIRVIEMRPGYLSGTQVRNITSELFERPSTVAFDGNDLLVVNFQYGVVIPVLPFTVVRVPIGG